MNLFGTYLDGIAAFCTGIKSDTCKCTEIIRCFIDSADCSNTRIFGLLGPVFPSTGLTIAYTIYLEPVWELNNYLSKLNCI